MLEAKDTNTSAPKKPEQNVCNNIFQAISKPNDLEKIFSANLQNFNHSKNSAVLKRRTGQFFEDLSLRGQELQNVSSMTPPMVFRGMLHPVLKIARG